MDPINRIARHLITPAVLLLVERGWLPDWAAGDLIEAAVILTALGGTLLWSYLDDKRRT